MLYFSAAHHFADNPNLLHCNKSLKKWINTSVSGLEVRKCHQILVKPI